MNPAQQIIIFQAAPGGINICCGVLKDLNLTRGKDFLAFPAPLGLEEAIATNSPQLFITSSWLGEMEPIVKLITEFRKKNPQLVVVMCDTSRETPPLLDKKIDTLRDPEWEEKLREVVKKFQKGELRRKAKPLH